MNEEEARSEVANLTAWVQDFEQRKQGLQEVLLRLAFLEGWLSARTEVEDADPELEPNPDVVTD